MGKILHLKAICNHEIAMIQENSWYIVQDYSLVTSSTKAEKYCKYVKTKLIPFEVLTIRVQCGTIQSGEKLCLITIRLLY